MHTHAYDRWAHDDPNPRAVIAKEFSNMQRVYRAVSDTYGVSEEDRIEEFEEGGGKRQMIGVSGVACHMWDVIWHVACRDGI